MKNKALLSLSLVTALFLQSNGFAKEDEKESNLGSVLIYGEKEEITSATKLDMTILETPQIVSVISDVQISDYNLKDTGAALEQVPGITIERVETDRTYFTSRGFNIVNFQYDGVGVPIGGPFDGQEDTSAYEQIEVIKGATGLITSLSNPSATVNFVRKRPTDETQAYISASYGSWSQKRVEGDVSGTLIEDKLKGRLVVAKEKGNSYLDRYSRDITSFYGVLSSDLTDTTKFTIGHSINDNRNKGISSGALPLFYSDGTVTDYDVSTNTAPDWAYKDLTLSKTFVELEQNINNNWTAKAIYSHNEKETDWEWFYLAGNPNPNTEDGLLAKAAGYEAKDEEDSIDLFISGYFEAFEQEHKVVVGANRSEVTLTGKSIDANAWNYDPIGGNWVNGDSFKPIFNSHDPATQSVDTNQTFTSYYISSRLNITNDLSVLLGARSVKIEQDGISYGASQKVDESEIVPYIGITYEFIDGTILYSSYSEVFNAQTQVDSSLNPLGPLDGSSYEIGLKQELNDGKAVLTIAYFGSEQDNLAEFIEQDKTSGLNTYKGTSVESDGYEIELSGEVYEGLNLSMGYTYLDIKDKDGNNTKKYIPNKQFKISSAYQVPTLLNLRLGASVRWQSEIYSSNTEVQGSYALVDMFTQYKATKNLSVLLNINNITDKKYRQSAQWTQSNYGAPRNATLTLKYTF